MSETGYVAVRPLKHGDGYIEPGEDVPEELVRPALISNGWIRKADEAEDLEPSPEPEEESGADEVEVQHRGGGWYDVLVGGSPANEKALRKDDAETLAAEHG